MKKILVVEDNPTNRMIFRDILEADGYEVECLERAEDALRLQRERLPDLILMDVQLPGMDGLTAARILSEDRDTGDVPIIAVTSHAMPGDRERALLAGCSGYITKPIRVKPFREQIALVLAGDDIPV